MDAHSLEQSQHMHVGVRMFVHLIPVLPVALAAVSMLLSGAEQGLFFKRAGKGLVHPPGLSGAGTWKLLDPGGREELGGAEEMLQPRGSGWGAPSSWYSQWGHS